MQQALNIPEILAQIGQFLDSSSLGICTRVSRSWSAAFGVILYRNISIKITLFRYGAPSLAVLERHARQIVSMTLIMPSDLEYFALKCPNLRALHLEGWCGIRLKTIPEYKDRGHSKTLELIQEHQPTLKTVSVGMLWPIAKSPEFWTAIAECPILETLLVRDEKMFARRDAREQQAFWGACTRVENLTLKNLRFWSAVNVPSALDFGQVRKLKLVKSEGWDADKQVEWMERCPELRVLKWVMPKVELPASGVDAPALINFSASWPNLRELTLSGYGIQDHNLAIVISTAQVLVKLSVPQTSFGRMAFAALRTHHFQVLKYLNFRECESVTSAMVQEAMASCPNLEFLRAPLLRSVDVLLGAPWVCLKLKQLQLQNLLLDADNTDEEVQKLALSARFSALKEVSLDFPHNLSIIR
ncbi:hypothetical protein CPC16_000703 [Podila verticillata]|uniref:F-box domain-containing protein n=1 Tax=Podila verticillata NRRL 6337 TaxID=1069443 RepID=A0A086TJT0_9FUNG|nr:hypothetical protein BGZ52_010200 [Haplosporangium bisporale]KAF9393929.1 hypothetical protein CPC16_000703 [Podila verticillata]KFH62207.1 hypothetical protein MVEG_11845 [Podila verticillata NRRL 6337]